MIKRANGSIWSSMNPSDEELDSIAARIMSNQEEVKKLSEQLNSQKLLKFFQGNDKIKEPKRLRMINS